MQRNKKIGVSYAIHLAIHLYMNTPPVGSLLFHIPDGFVSKIAVSFSNNWYDVTDGLASAEQ